MTKQTAINIGLQIGTETIDLRIPKLVQKAKLKHLIQDTLQNKGIILPETWELVPVNKQIQVHNTKKLSNYPLNNGDQLRIQYEKE